MTVPRSRSNDRSIDAAGAAGTARIFAGLVDAGLTGVGVPTSLGGAGGARGAALIEVMRVGRTDPEAAAALASHQCVIGSLLAGRNVGLRDRRVPALARGELSGIWPSSAIDDMLHRGTATVQARDAAGGLLLAGPLGRVNFGERHPSVLLCPVQWSAAHPPGLALLDGDREGMRFAAQPRPGIGAPDTKLASLDDVYFSVDELVDADGSRIAMIAELQALHSIVGSWLERTTSLGTGPTGALVRDGRERP
jgi:alkylation response protein AidB-like acyl-CoA dehydrogenase